MIKLPLRKIFIFLFFTVGIGIGFYKYGFQRIYHSYSQWDLKTHITATQRVIGNTSQFNPDFVERAYLPPFLPIAYPLFSVLGNINWNVTKFVWVLLSSILIIIMIYITFRQIKEIDPDFTINHLALIMLFVFLFKGTFLLLAAGQISVLVIFLLILFFHFQIKNEKLSVIVLALASFKLNLVLPFYLYLLLKQKYRLFLFASALALLLNLAVSLAYLGPIGHLNQIWESFQQFESVSRNSYLLKALSGRVDLAPFLAVFGVEGIALNVLQAIIFLSGLTAIFIYRKQIPDRLLLFNSIALFYTIFYYRDYDVLLLLLIALPFIWINKDQFQWWHILAFFPVVLPIQKIYEMGVNTFPAGGLIYNLIGTSMIVSVIVLVIFLNNFKRIKLNTKSIVG